MGRFEIIKNTNKTSTSSDYVTLPRLTQVEIDALTGVSNGSLVFNTTTNRQQLFNGTWINVVLPSDITGTNSGVNTGDETTITIQTKRPLKTIEGQSLEGSGNIDLSKSDVGLSNVDNTTDINKPVSTLQAAADTAILNAAQAYADNLAIGLIDLRGGYNASTNLFPSSGGSGTAGAILKGDLFVVTIAGSLNGIAVTQGDTILALIDSPAQIATNWNVNENNLGYVPENVANKVTTITGNENSNIFYASSKAIVDWVTSLFVAKTTTINTKPLSANVVLATSDILDTTNKRYVTDANLIVLGNTSNTNTGDNAINSQYSGLATSKEDAVNKQADLIASAIKFPTVNAVNAGLSLKENTITAGTLLQYYRGDKTFQTLDKIAVGLSNVVNVDTSITTNVTEGINLYYTNSRGIGSSLTGYLKGSGVISNTDTILQAVQKLDGNMDLLPTFNDLNSWSKENFLSSAIGTQLVYTVTTASGGTNTLVTTPENASDVTVSTPLKVRTGKTTLNITNANNSRAVLQTNALYRTFTEADFAFKVEYSMITSATVVDFVLNDPVLIAVGFFDDMSIANPLNGFYIRPPRSGETLFYRLCVRVAGVETISAITSAVYDPTVNRYVSVQIGYNGSTNIVTSIIRYNNLTFTNIILTFNTTFPAVALLSLRQAIGVNRNGTALVGVIRGISIDKTYSYIKTNY